MIWLRKVDVLERNRFFRARTQIKYPLAPKSLSSKAFVAKTGSSLDPTRGDRSLLAQRHKGCRQKNSRANQRVKGPEPKLSDPCSANCSCCRKNLPMRGVNCDACRHPNRRIVIYSLNKRRTSGLVWWNELLHQDPIPLLAS